MVKIIGKKLGCPKCFHREIHYLHPAICSNCNNPVYHELTETERERAIELYAGLKFGREEKARIHESEVAILSVFLADENKFRCLKIGSYIYITIR